MKMSEKQADEYISVKEILEMTDVTPDVLVKINKEIQKMVNDLDDQYNGVQIAVAMVITLKIIANTPLEQQLIQTIADSFDIIRTGGKDIKIGWK